MAEPVVRQLGGRYEVRSLIGRGGMADVHMGFDTRLSRVVAVKMLREELAKDHIFQARFRREAQSAASLNHPNIVAVYDTGEEPIIASDGRQIMLPYIVMEYVEGHTVKDLLSDGTPVPIDEAAEIVSGVLSALEYSHAKGLVHRDIKPGNIMLTTQSKVKVMDFGIARALTDSQSTMTQTNAVVGTAQYLSPEQARGEQVDTRSDLYSTGVVLFELLTGRPPFKGDSAVAIAYQHVQELPPVPSSIASDIPDSMDRIVLKALAKDPADRYPTASSMKADLIRLATGAQVNAPETSVWAAALPVQQTQVTQALPVSGTPTAGIPAQLTLQDGTQVMATVPAHALQQDATTTKKKKPTALIVSVLLLLAVLLAGLYYVFGTGSDEPQSVTVAVPDVTGQTQEQAKQAIEAAGLKWAIAAEEASDTVPANSVIRTEPPAGSSVTEGSTVQAVLSTGPASTTIPGDLVNMTPEQAKAALEAAGLVYELSPDREASDDIAEGKVVRTNPSPGEKVKSGSTVVVYLSSGTNKIVIPDLSGMTQDQAREALTALGLSVSSVTQENHPSIKAGQVIYTTPASGTDARKGDQVQLVLSDGKVTIPSGLLNTDYQAVGNTLMDLGLEVFLEEVENSAAVGTVLRMSVAEGSSVNQGSTVTLTVSTGPATPATSSQ